MTVYVKDKAGWCALCSNEDEKRVCTDRKLAKHFKNSSPKAISATCLFRRTLAYLLTVETVSIPYLQESLGVDIEYAEGIMEKLKEEKIIEDSVSEEYIVSKEVLQLSGLPKFLGIKRFKQMSFTKQEDVVFNQPSIIGIVANNNARKEINEDIQGEYSNVVKTTKDIENKESKKIAIKRSLLTVMK